MRSASLESDYLNELLTAGLVAVAAVVKPVLTPRFLEVALSFRELGKTDALKEHYRLTLLPPLSIDLLCASDLQPHVFASRQTASELVGKTERLW